ncbi:BRCT domain-containing protein [Auricularia subglabra TFB-10046 SS5]|nr:BRCT domain-containing protein [Auricularia subglabra TFB-10046 SS5]
MASQGSCSRREHEQVCHDHVFAGVSFYIASTVASEVSAGLCKVLKANGGESVVIELATHIISDTDAFDNWRNAGSNVFVVTPCWVDRSMTAGAQQGPQFFSPHPQKLFSGIIACSGDLLDHDKEAARLAITHFGGQWREALTDDVTHLFCLSASSDQYKKAMANRVHSQIRILLLNWLDDCLTTWRLIPYEPYSFPNPPLLGMGASLAPAVEAMLGHGGAEIVATNQPAEGGSDFVFLEMCDVLVTRYRDDPLFAHGLRQGKVIGTLQWVFHVDQSGKYSAPTDQLLHFPMPSWPIKGFSEQCITITNYSGVSRDYVKKLIEATGANFTATLTPRSTQVIASSTQGKKVEKAREWGIAVVSHLWLEDCLLQWKLLTPANTKYLWFPRNGDLTANLGECAIGRYTIDMWEKELTQCPGAEKPCWSPSQHSAPNSEVDDSCLALSGTLPPAGGSQSAPATTTAVTMRKVDEASFIPMIASLSPHLSSIKQSYTKAGDRPKAKTNIGMREDEGGAYTISNDLPKPERAQGSDRDECSNEPLAQQLAEQVSLRSKRYGTITSGSKRSRTEREALPVAKRVKAGGMQSNAAVLKVTRRNKPGAEEAGSDGPESEEDEYDGPGSERVSVDKPKIILDLLPAATVPTTATGKVFYFATQVPISDHEAEVLAELGANPATKPAQVTHLIADQVVRTKKFLSGINYAPAIVNSDWVKESVEKRRLLPEEGYLLKHPASAKKYDVDLTQAVELAKGHKATLLQGCTFYITKTGVRDLDLVKAIVHSAGGKIRAGAPSLRQAREERSYVISHKDDHSMWKNLARNGVTIYTSDFLLNGVLHQKLPVNDKSYQLNEE